MSWKTGHNYFYKGETMKDIDFTFNGTGLGYLWIFIWTNVLTIITFGLFFPWAASAAMRWFVGCTTLNGKKLVFRGTGLAFLGNWLLIMVLSVITFGLYLPWGMCRVYRWMINNIHLATIDTVSSSSA